MPQRTHQKTFHCPFNCGHSYTRLETLKSHLQSNRVSPDERHSACDTETWEKVRNEGLDTWVKRPGGLTEGEKKRRKRKVAEKYRLEHRDEIQGNRRDRRVEINRGLRLLKRAAKIGIKERQFRLFNDAITRQSLFQKALPDHQPTPLACFLDPDTPATFETFS